jgi:phage shock protein A
VRARCQAALPACALDQRAFDKFERLREKVERAEAEAEALGELAAGRDPGPEPESEVRHAESAVEAELAALKKKVGRPS